MANTVKFDAEKHFHQLSEKEQLIVNIAENLGITPVLEEYYKISYKTIYEINAMISENNEDEEDEVYSNNIDIIEDADDLPF